MYVAMHCVVCNPIWVKGQQVTPPPIWCGVVVGGINFHSGELIAHLNFCSRPPGIPAKT